MDLVVVSLLAAVFLVMVYVWGTRNNSYWRKKGVVQLEPAFLVGNISDLLLVRKSIHDFDLDMYRALEGHRFGGFYELWKPALCIRDPDLIRDMTVKCFDHFVDRRSFDLDDSAVYVKLMLLSLKGQQWKDVRSVISPTFTSGKMKRMFGSVVECAEHLAEYLSAFAKSKENVDMRDAFGRFTMDVIANTGFGVQCNNSFKSKESAFTRMAERFMSPGAIRIFFLLMHNMLPKFVANFFRLPTFDKEAMDFFVAIIKETVAHREKSGVKGNDYLQLLMDARKGELEGYELDSQEPSKCSKQVLSEPMLIAQGLLFFLAGFETTASALSFLTYELARNPSVQEKVAQEVNNVLRKHGGKITYDGINEMVYLDMVLQESLRLHTPASRVERVCTADYVIPETSVVIEKGTIVLAPISGIHYDENYYPDPERFCPDRFSPEEKEERHPYTNLTFGHGPRNCIGQRFALMETKAAAAMVISNYRLWTSQRTQIPIKYFKRSNVLKAEDGIWLRLENRT